MPCTRQSSLTAFPKRRLWRTKAQSGFLIGEFRSRLWQQRPHECLRQRGRCCRPAPQINAYSTQLKNGHKQLTRARAPRHQYLITRSPHEKAPTPTLLFALANMHKCAHTGAEGPKDRKIEVRYHARAHAGGRARQRQRKTRTCARMRAAHAPECMRWRFLSPVLAPPASILTRF